MEELFKRVVRSDGREGHWFDYEPTGVVREFVMNGMAAGVSEMGKVLGYDGVVNPAGCCCMWDDFPACGDICTNCRFGYRCKQDECPNIDLHPSGCITDDGDCHVDNDNIGGFIDE